MYASVKNKGKTIGYIIEQYIGKTGKRLFLVFVWFFSILVVAAFADIVAATFNGFDANGGRIPANAAVASTSALFVAAALGLGLFLHRRKPGNLTGSLVAIALLCLCIFLGMTFSGEAYHILLVFAQIILVILVLHIVILLYEYLLAGGLSHKNPFKLLLNMLPAYFTALGTSSSAATIPVTLKQTLKNGVTDGIAGFTIPLCATIHLSGSMMKITCCALTICLINGMPCNLPLFLNFIFVLAICMVAAPGVPGGAVMAALGPLASVLGFNADMQALMIALYIAMDSFGTACNVTGDGAIAIVVDKIFRKDK